MNQLFTLSNVKARPKYGVQKMTNGKKVVWQLQLQVVEIELDVGVLLHDIQGTDCFTVHRENTNSDVYCDILDNYLVPTVQLYGLEDEFMFQHDNAR